MAPPANEVHSPLETVLQTVPDLRSRRPSGTLATVRTNRLSDPAEPEKTSGLFDVSKKLEATSQVVPYIVTADYIPTVQSVSTPV